MIIVKLTSKVQKNIFEHAKNKKNSEGRVPGLTSSTYAFGARRAPPNFFHLPTALKQLVEFR